MGKASGILEEVQGVILRLEVDAVPRLLGGVSVWDYDFMMAGVGLYAPCMAMVYMLGLSPLVAFPIMMGSCAGLMAIGSPEFIKAGNYARKGSIAIAIGGVIGVTVAYTLVKSMPLEVLTWVIIGVVILTGISMIRQGAKKEA